MTVRVRPLTLLPFLVSLACALWLAHESVQDRRFLLPLALVIVAAALPALLARRRMRHLLMSGNVQRVLETWQRSIERIMYPETMAPLMIATAYASYGWVEAARRALARAVRGPAWDAALEQRLFVETLLDTFEGEREQALSKANALVQLPLPRGGVLARRRITRLRQGMYALARAFAHQSDAVDEKRLVRAASTSPLVHWAMRYGAAVVAIDHGKRKDARALLAGAPEWPNESAFKSFHDEIAQLLVT